MFNKLIILIAFLGFNILTTMAQKTIHDFIVEDITGEKFDMIQFKGKKLLIVNTASECGLTPQYETLEEVYNEYKGKGFEIVGFPANNFGSQEPGSNKEIETFCLKNYGVSFNMMSKISVKGDDQHEIYQWLTKMANNGVEDAEVSWNFQKFMIDKNGNYVGMVKPQESPACEEIINWINE